MAINAPIQGTAADLIKKAMIQIHRSLKEGFKARMILQVHDELVIEAPSEETQAVSDLVREKMAGAMKLNVPLVVDISTGSDWAASKY